MRSYVQMKRTDAGGKYPNYLCERIAMNSEPAFAGMCFLPIVRKRSAHCENETPNGKHHEVFDAVR